MKMLISLVIRDNNKIKCHAKTRLIGNNLFLHILFTHFLYLLVGTCLVGASFFANVLSLRRQTNLYYERHLTVSIYPVCGAPFLI